MFPMSLLQKQSKDRFGLEGDEESTMLEESVSPKKYVIHQSYLLCHSFKGRDSVVTHVGWWSLGWTAIKFDSPENWMFRTCKLMRFLEQTPPELEQACIWLCNGYDHI